MTGMAGKQRRFFRSFQTHGLNVLLMASFSIALITVGRNLLLVSGNFGGNAAIECRESTHWVGLANSRTMIDHTFKVFNVGGSDLIISGIASDCRCTRVSPTIFPQLIPPGQSLPVSVTMDPDRLTGRVRKRLFVFSNDLRNPRLQLTLEAEIVESAVAEDCPAHL